MKSLRALLSISVSMLTIFHPTTLANSSPIFVYAQSPVHSNVLSIQLRSAQPKRAGSLEFKSPYTQACIWATNAPDFSESSNEVVAGYRYRLHQLAIEALMIENIRNMDNSTDIGFTLGFCFSI